MSRRFDSDDLVSGYIEEAIMKAKREFLSESDPGDENDAQEWRTGVDPEDEKEYQARVINDLRVVVDEYLSFSTINDLFRLLAETV